jgi:hypothetical protein
VRIRIDLAVLGGMYAVANIEKRLGLPASFDEITPINQARHHRPA